MTNAAFAAFQLVQSLTLHLRPYHMRSIATLPRMVQLRRFLILERGIHTQGLSSALVLQHAISGVERSVDFIVIER